LPFVVAAVADAAGEVVVVVVVAVVVVGARRGVGSQKRSSCSNQKHGDRRGQVRQRCCKAQNVADGHFGFGCWFQCERCSCQGQS